MLKIPATYEALLKRVKQTLIEGQQRIESGRVRTYWETGRIIHGHILQNKDRAEYGTQTVANIARDLKVNKTLINRCLQFAQTYPSLPNVAARQHLSWSHYRSFIAITDEKTRLRLEEAATRNAWSSRELEERIKLDHSQEDKPLPPKRKIPQTPLVPLRGELYTYRIVTRPTVGAAEDSGLLIDLGFGIFRECDSKSVAENDIVRSAKRDDAYRLTKIEATAAQLFTYVAYVERVIDGDTLKVRMDLGFGMFTRHELRLRGIDCPEMFIDLPSTAQNVKSKGDLTLKKKRSITKAGESARVFVQSYIKEAQQIIVRSSRNDKYDRYLADVFLPGEEGKDIYLNNLLIENGHAVRM